MHEGPLEDPMRTAGYFLAGYLRTTQAASSSDRMSATLDAGTASSQPERRYKACGAGSGSCSTLAASQSMPGLSQRGSWASSAASRPCSAAPSTRTIPLAESNPAIARRAIIRAELPGWNYRNRIPSSWQKATTESAIAS